jgi:hypothetical protein
MYKLNKDEIVELVDSYCLQMQETASKIGQTSAFGFLTDNENSTISVETVAHEAEQLAATLRAYNG